MKTEYILEDIIEKFIDYRGKTPSKTTSGIPLITAKIVKNGKIETPNEFIAEEDYESWMTRGYPEINDIVLTTEAPLGEIALIKDKNVALAQRIITMRGKPDVVDNVYLKYFFQSRDGQYELDSRASGTTVFGIKAAVLRKIPVLIPPLPEQKAIASVLSSLDDKIDLLHRQNKTLEAMAETLFRQWFVEEADDSWEEGTLGDIMHLSNGKSRPKTIGTIPVYGGNGILDYTDTSNYSGESIIIGRVGAYCGSLYFENGQIWVSDNALHAKAKHEKENLYLFYQLKYLQLNTFAEGSSHPLLTQTLLNSIDIKIPPNDLRQRYNSITENYHQKIATNKSHIKTIESIRETLLPKLMSGEIKVFE